MAEIPVAKALPVEDLIQSFFVRREPFAVASSNVAWIQYDRARNVLFVGYKNASSYAYGDVSEQEAAAFLFASSKGKWVWDNLRVRGKGNARKTRKNFARVS